MAPKKKFSAYYKAKAKNKPTGAKAQLEKEFVAPLEKIVGKGVMNVLKKGAILYFP